MQNLRQYVEGFPVYLERNTNRVPNDGQYYVIEEDRVIGRFRRLSDARRLYQHPVYLTAKGASGVKVPAIGTYACSPQELKDPIVFFGGRSYVCPVRRSQLAPRVTAPRVPELLVSIG